MPSKQRLGPHNGSKLVKHATPQPLGPNSQAPALVIIQSQAFAPKLFTKGAVFLLKVVVDILLLLAHLSGKRNQEQSKGIHWQAHWVRLPL